MRTHTFFMRSNITQESYKKKYGIQLYLIDVHYFMEHLFNLHNFSPNETCVGESSNAQYVHCTVHTILMHEKTAELLQIFVPLFGFDSERY